MADSKTLGGVVTVNGSGANWVWPIALCGGLIFGAGDQFLGSFPVITTVGFWTISISLMSAPWLVLPFLFGCTQASPKRAASVGLAATYAALLGYFLMIMGPFEGGQWSFGAAEVRGLIVSNWENILGGLVTAPLYGFLGYHWRTHRSWVSAALVAGAVCFEPVAQTLSGRTYPGDAIVWPAEIMSGVVMAVVFGWFGVAFRRRRSLELGSA